MAELGLATSHVKLQ